MLVVELSKLLRRPRTWITIALLAGLPVVVGVFLRTSGIGPLPAKGRRCSPTSSTTGSCFPVVALALILPIFLPVATAVIAGDSIAGEANAGTCGTCSSGPFPGRALVAKLVTVVVFVLLAVVVVAAIGYVAGGILFGLEPVTSVSGSTLSTEDAGAAHVGGHRLHHPVDARAGRHRRVRLHQDRLTTRRRRLRSPPS